jgi:hypothetical protein
MPKRISKKLKDSNQIAAAVVALSTAEDTPTDAATLSKVMAEMGRRGGKIGGKRRLETMTPAKRKAAARKAANARWSNTTPSNPKGHA